MAHILPRRYASLRTFGSLASSTHALRPSSFLLRKPQYSTLVDDGALKELPNLDPSKLEIVETTSLKDVVPAENLVFGRYFTDHMLAVEWTATDGWLPPRITSYQNFSLDPATCVLHYAFTAFEGMKAYKNSDGSVRLFRPEKNMARLNKSVARLALPTFDGKAYVELMKQFVKLDARHIPAQRGYSLYLRPTMIGTQRTLGVGPPGSALLFLIASPVGPYYPSGFKAVSLEASSKNVRAWPGGVGDSKLGANYAPCVVPQIEAAKKGFHQNLWLFKDPADGEEYVTEVGTMNLFVAWKLKDGTKEIVTAPLDGTILEGVTRDSVLDLARERLAKDGWKVSERKYTMKEMDEAASEGRLLEVFGTGTAAVVSPVRNINWNGKNIDCGLAENEEVGKLTKQVKDWIDDIQYGDEPHPWSVRVV